MAKVTLEFDFNEDREEMESAINGWKWKMLVWDLDQNTHDITSRTLGSVRSCCQHTIYWRA